MNIDSKLIFEAYTDDMVLVQSVREFILLEGKGKRARKHRERQKNDSPDFMQQMHADRKLGDTHRRGEGGEDEWVGEIEREMAPRMWKWWGGRLTSPLPLLSHECKNAPVNPTGTQPDPCIMKIKFTLFAAVLAAVLFGVGCASTEPAFASDGLVAHYPFNGNTNDQSVNGNNGKSAMAKFSIDRHGNPSGSLVCDGAKGKVTVDGNKQIQDLAKKDSTISLWVKLERQQPVSSILRKEEDYLLYAGKSGELYVERFSHVKVAGGFHRVNTTKGVTVNRWMHVCCTWDESGIKLYLDSKYLNLEKEERSHLPVSLGVRRLLSFGIANNDTQALYGALDDVRIYNRALSAEEVKALYDLEKPKGE